MVKLEDEDTGDIYLTKLACGLLDLGSCKCGDYPNRFSKMPDCLSITPEATRSLEWLPATCAYRLIEEGKDLPWWHPLVSGSENTVHEVGISVRGWAASETGVKPADLESYIVKGFPKTRKLKAPPKHKILQGRKARAAVGAD
jgi:uncharacterized protein